MDQSPKLKKDLNPQELSIILAYAYAADSQAFLDLLKDLYRSCRKKAQEGFEKNGDTSAYWSGRADGYEILLDNCLAAQKTRLKN